MLNKIFLTIAWLVCTFFSFAFWNVVKYDVYVATGVIDASNAKSAAAAAALIVTVAKACFLIPFWLIWRSDNTEVFADGGSANSVPLANGNIQNSARPSELKAESVKRDPSEASNKLESGEGLGAVSEGPCLKDKNRKNYPQSKTSKATKTLYDILGVSSRARDAEIFAAHRRLVQRWHSDKHFGYQRATTQKLQWLNRAQEVLTDSQKRAAYDRQLAKHGSSK